MLKLSPDITEQDIALFMQEAEELLALLDEDIVKLEEQKDNTSLLQEIFRASHTLKGSSATLGHVRMAEVAHAMENLLDGVRKGALPVTPQLVDALLSSLDFLKELVQELITREQSGVDIAPILTRLKEIATGVDSTDIDTTISCSETEIAMTPEAKATFSVAITQGLKGYRIKISLTEQTSWAAVRCFQLINTLVQMGEVILSVPTLEDIQAERVGQNLQVIFASRTEESQISEALNTIDDVENIEIQCVNAEDIAPDEKGSSSSSREGTVREVKTNQTIRVNVGRLDTLMEQIGELVVNRNRINQLSKMLEDKYRSDDLISDLGKMSTQVGKIVNEIQQDIMKIRMLPIEVVFNGFPRMVRDLARSVNKKIEFAIEGQETEIDRSITEHIRDPLVHILRNAVDHGVELPQQRKEAGKREKALVRLSAYHEENQLVVVIEDDGRGLDPAIIKESAVKKGLISVETARMLDDEQANELIFMSGLSTARSTTEISGRGVGMDVVKTNIESLNGTISIDSVAGKGTRFTIKLPLTLAIVPSLLVSVSNTLCAIPLSHIVETVAISPEMIKTVKKREVTFIRGSALPLIRLASYFGWGSANCTDFQNINIVVVKSGNVRVGLVVDSLLEQQEIVIKPLSSFFENVKGIAGASVLGDGQVTLVIDIASLLQMILADCKQGVKSCFTGTPDIMTDLVPVLS